ncbi:MAG: protein translocase subunit SecD [Verrucomicrobiota bacterium]
MMSSLALTAALPAWLEKITTDPLSLFFYGLLLLVLFGWYFATEHERRKRDVGTVLLVLVTLLCVVALLPLEKKLKGAIDIQGGSSFTMQVQPRDDENGNKVEVTQEDTDNAIIIMEKRLNESGIAEPVIFRQGVDRFVVQMPGVKPEEAQSVRRKLEEAAKLELREVHPQSETLADQVAAGDHIEPGYKVFPYTYKINEGTPEEKEMSTNILLNRRPAVQGRDIVRASPDMMGGGRVDITLNGEGEDKMIALTSPMAAGRDRIAIVLDGRCISAPVVQQVPLGKQFQITGLNAPGEAVSLAKNLMNPINNPLKVDEERTVSPTLGAAVVKQGVMSGLIGLAATFVFILIYYRFAGFVALVGLVINTVMLFGIMAMFGFAFSLPGIAGIVLTIGMAVDANVLIYERLREEIAAGKSVKNALAIAYEKAFTAIFDSNFTSLITALLLFWRASGTVKGFAITLTIGLVASMFASILVTRVLFRWCVDKNMIKTFKFANLIRPSSIDFLGKRGAAAAISFALIFASVGVFFVKKDQALGIDFTGGTIITYNIGQSSSLPFADVEKAIKGMTLSKAAVPLEENNLLTGRLLTVRCDNSDAPAIEELLAKTFPEIEKEQLQPSREEVSALLGKEFLMDSGLALLMGMFLIFLYVSMRYRLSFAVGAIIALFHDVILSCGLVVIFGNQLSLIHIAAILTIAGYSINDTVIIFDRIRETLRYSTKSLKEIMNEAINATLSRTVLTSGATLFSVAALYVFGGQSMQDFSLMILIGIIVGTYSSIFVASALVLWWAKINKADYRESEETKASAVEVVG